MAIQKNPYYIDAYSNLLELMEKSNRHSEMHQLISEAENFCAGNPFLARAKSQLFKNQGDYEKAYDVLKQSDLPDKDSVFQANHYYELGDICDKLNKVDEAYQFFLMSNRVKSTQPDALTVNKNTYLKRIAEMKEFIKPENVSSWPKSQDIGYNIAFLVGFPRSGTTLIDNILRSHADIAVLEEKETLSHVRAKLQQYQGGDPYALKDLTQKDIEELQNIYFDELSNNLPEDEKHAKLIIDKLPLHIVNIGIIYRLFPQAKIIFALRHPCDCVLSCFMHLFKLNNAMANFLDLQDSAFLYDKVMDLWVHCNSLLDLNIHTICYEDMVNDFETTVKTLISYLEVGWDTNVLHYYKTAQKRKINTPSYNQVTQKIYNNSMYRWLRFKKHMEPVLPLLTPWAEHFGYADHNDLL